MQQRLLSPLEGILKFSGCELKLLNDTIKACKESQEKEIVVYPAVKRTVEGKYDICQRCIFEVCKALCGAKNTGKSLRMINNVPAVPCAAGTCCY